jgi:hypothetical protein
VRLSQVRLQAPAAAMAAQAGFYGGELGLEVSDGGWQIGWSQLAFSPATAASGPPPEPFYHFALLVPGDRFAAARDWAQQRVELLEIFDSGEVVIRFDNWGADACYFHDPAENIVELIAHDQVGVSGADGPFRAAELLGLAEIGLVGERVRVAAALAELGLEIFQGSVDPAERLAFMGEPSAAVILAEAGGGWLPRGRPAEAWPAQVEVELPGAHRATGQVADATVEIHRVWLSDERGNPPAGRSRP